MEQLIFKTDFYFILQYLQPKTNFLEAVFFNTACLYKFLNLKDVRWFHAPKSCIDQGFKKTPYVRCVIGLLPGQRSTKVATENPMIHKIPPFMSLVTANFMLCKCKVLVNMMATNPYRNTCFYLKLKCLQEEQWVAIRFTLFPNNGLDLNLVASRSDKSLSFPPVTVSHADNFEPYQILWSNFLHNTDNGTFQHREGNKTAGATSFFWRQQHFMFL